MLWLLTATLVLCSAMSATYRIKWRKQQRINLYKDKLLMQLSHDLRNPIQNIIVWAEILKRRGMDTSLFLRNAKTILTVVESILDIARVRQEKLHLRREPLNFNTVVTECLHDMEARIHDNGLHLTYAQGCYDNLVLLDRVVFTRCIYNLVENAIKFTPKGGRLNVSIENDDTHVTLAITDTGIGIPPKKLKKLFKAYSQLGECGSGLGLGLSICMYAITLHGGTLTAQSKGVNQGSSFLIKLPLYKNEKEHIAL